MGRGTEEEDMNTRRTSDAPISSTSIRREIDRLEEKKADKEATRIKLDEVDKDIDETKKIALSARKKAGEHSCIQEARMDQLEEDSKSWGRFFKGLVVAVVSAVVVVGGFMAALHYTKAEASEVQDVKVNVIGIQRDMAEVKTSQKKVEMAVRASTKSQAELEEERVRLLKKAMKEAIREAKADIKPNHRRRRTR